jgi:hypothetical protein
MIRLERIRRDSHGLDESKAITSEAYVPLASEPIGRWPTGRNRLVLYLTGGGPAPADASGTDKAQTRRDKSVKTVP